MQIYELDGLVPVISPQAFVHETAVIIGDVFIEEGVYIGPNASIRGDFGRIIIKKNANIQDCCVCHSFPNIDVIVEENGHIGHSAILHGCHVKYNAMVGMGAVVMDEAVIGENAVIGASSLVPSKMEIPANHLAFGNPAKVRRELKPEEINWKKDGSQAYTNLAYNCLENLKKCEPLNSSNEQRDSLRCDMHYKPKHN
ncbi:phenylacetic acid degradation protein PaaY [Arcobacter sp. LA11]|uniref:phenylacetic acid degradation protein PaaY n=1 Tax=Arcobacter sp. LA11 TaxID=1898176 RepID=UPI00093530C7|nr:phenylacetic acid degradation protein PaaY [Arcobacter sp. LA11]